MLSESDRWAGWPERWAGGESDVRTVVGAMSGGVKDAFRYDAIPWERFPHHYGRGEEVPVLLATLASADAAGAERALARLWEALHHQGGGTDVAAPAVPFLIRIAMAGQPGLRARTLHLVAEIGRCLHLGDGSREGFLQVAEDPLMMSGATECPVDWAIQAARGAVTSDLHLLLPLLAEPDADVRSAVAFVVAVASGEFSRVSVALRRRLAVEDDPAVQVSLILAVAQLAREHRDEKASGWARELWSDGGRPLHVRVGAGLAWLCLVDEVVPDELRVLLTGAGTDRLGEAFQKVPWFPPVDGTNGLRRCIRDMVTPNVP